MPQLNEYSWLNLFFKINIMIFISMIFFNYFFDMIKMNWCSKFLNVHSFFLII